MAHDSVRMYKIRKLLEELSRKSGRGTELITVYIPKGKQLHEIIGTLQQEQGTADNIKSDTTRSHVVASLGKVVQRLKLLKKTPERGLAVFCGALPPDGGGPLGSETVQVWEIDPPKDLRQYLYRCDDHFHTDILKDMLKDDDMVGFLALDAKDAGWGLLRGDRIEVLDHTSSGVAGKHRQGGQSAKRFQRLREMEMNYYFNRVADTTRRYFVDMHKVKGLVVSGPGPTKEEFVNGGYLEYRLQNSILATVDASYAGPEGIREACSKAAPVLSDYRMVEEKALVEELFKRVNSRSGLGAYGLAEVTGLLKNSVVETLLVTDSTGLVRAWSRCRKCGAERESAVESGRAIAETARMQSEPCGSCGSEDSESGRQDIVDHLALLAGKAGSKMEVISGSSEHGAMLASLGSVGALLRYNPAYGS